MAGKRLVDAAKLFNAAQGIAKQHLALRSKQFDVYSKTSTLAKAVKSQTDRVTVTAEAAYALSERLNQTGPNYASAFSTQPQSERGDESVPRRDSVGGSWSQDGIRQGIAQDHHYEKQEGNATVEPVPQEELDVRQEKPARYPLQDGSIPPAGAQLDGPPSDSGKDTYAARGTPEPPKEPATTKADALHPVESGASTIPDPRRGETTATPNLSSEDTRKSQRKAESQIPSIAADSQPQTTPVQNQDVFHARSKSASPELSSLPRTKLPKHTEDTQGSAEHVKDGQMNQDVYYSSEGQQAQEQVPWQEAEPVQEVVPEGINTDVFHSPKISKLLGGQKSGDGQEGLRMKAASGTPADDTKLTEGKDQDSFYVRPLGSGKTDQLQASQVDISGLTIRYPDEDVKKLASAVSKDTASSPDAVPDEVWWISNSRILLTDY